MPMRDLREVRSTMQMQVEDIHHREADWDDIDSEVWDIKPDS